MIRLIVTDIDGTLLNHKKEIPEGLYSATEQILNKNIVFCAASGRQTQSLQQIFKPYYHQMGLISENGALVIYEGEELYSDPMSDTEMQLLLAKSKEIEGISITICGKKSAYLISDDNEIMNYIKLHYPALIKVNGLEDIDDELFKFTIYDKLGSREHSYPHFKEFEKDIKVAVSSDYWLDFTKKSVNKGVAIDHIQEKLGISPDETLVFGDYLNDLEMMQCAKYSYAMKNAQSEVKAVSNFITKYDNNKNGVLKTLEELRIIKL